MIGSAHSAPIRACACCCSSIAAVRRRRATRRSPPRAAVTWHFSIPMTSGCPKSSSASSMPCGAARMRLVVHGLPVHRCRGAPAGWRSGATLDCTRRLDLRRGAARRRHDPHSGGRGRTRAGRKGGGVRPHDSRLRGHRSVAATGAGITGGAGGCAAVPGRIAGGSYRERWAHALEDRGHALRKLLVSVAPRQVAAVRAEYARNCAALSVDYLLAGRDADARRARRECARHAWRHPSSWRAVMRLIWHTGRRRMLAWREFRTRVGRQAP